MSVTEALIAISQSDRHGAIDIAQRAARSHPESALARLLADYLSSAGRSGVYDEPTAFEDFIDRGGNPALYAAVIAALRNIHHAIGQGRHDSDRHAGRPTRPMSVLDIGCGDGRVTTATVPGDAALHLLEPAATLLDAAHRVLAGRTGDVTSSQLTLTDMLATHPGTWDVVQSTFAMSAIPPGERRPALRDLTVRTRRLLIVEFDLPDFDDGSPSHATYAAERYERGVAEYAEWPNVQSGFLMPVLVGQFDPERPRHTFEQSARAWTDELQAAGWTAATTTLAPYWWADAVLIDARPTEQLAAEPA